MVEQFERAGEPGGSRCASGPLAGTGGGRGAVASSSPPIPLTPEEQRWTAEVNRGFHRAFVAGPEERERAGAIRRYLDVKARVLSRTYRFGLVNNRLHRSDGLLVVPYLMCDTLVLYRVRAGDPGDGGEVSTHRIDPGALLTDACVQGLAGVEGETIDLEPYLFQIDPDRLEVGPIDRLRDIAALLEKVNECTNRNEVIFYLRHLVARLARPAGGETTEAKNLLPEVHRLTRALVVFLNGQAARRLPLLTRITVRNLPALLGRSNLLDRLWSDTVDLAEVHVAGSPVVNEIRRTSHHALGRRTLALAGKYLEYLERGDWSPLIEHGFGQPSPADVRARDLAVAREIVRRVVGDLEQLLGATEIVSRLRNWRESYGEAIQRCGSGRDVLDEVGALVEKGIRAGNRWTYLQHLRTLEAWFKTFALPDAQVRACLDRLQALKQAPPGQPGFDAEEAAHTATHTVSTFLETAWDRLRDPLFSFLDRVEKAYLSGAHLETFREVHTARQAVADLFRDPGFPEQRYHLTTLDCLLEELGYLALRHVASRTHEPPGLETCFEIIRTSVANLAFDGLQSRELQDLSEMLDAQAHGAEELENILTAIVGCYHKIRRRVTWPFETMASRFGLDPEETRAMVANIQRYLHDLNSMVGFCDLARKRIQAPMAGEGAGGKKGGDLEEDGISRFRIRHISHRDSVERVRTPGGRENLRDECGGKGSGLLYINHLNIPTRDGFILPTTIPRARFHIEKREELEAHILEHVRTLEQDIEQRTGVRRRFGDARSPLLLAVRGGSVFSMPGILSTVVFVGMNDEIARALAEDGPWSAYDSYRRFLASYALAAWEFDLEPYGLVEAAKRKHGKKLKEELPWEAMYEVAEESKRILRENGFQGALDRILNDLDAQLFGAVHAIFASWESHTARRYREIKGLCHSWHTAVIVQEMAFGNRMNAAVAPGMDETQASLTGVIPRTAPTDGGMWRLQGEFKFSAAGDDLVGGVTSSRSIRDIAELRGLMPVLDMRLQYTMTKLCRFMGMDQEIEFTVDRGCLSVLQARSAVAAADQPPDRFIDPGEPVARGLGIRGGAFRGAVAFDEEDLNRLSQEVADREEVDGVVLLIDNPTPEDIPLIISANAVVTARGGSTSHAAIAVNGVEDKAFFGVMSVAGLVVKPGRKTAVFIGPDGRIRAKVGPGDVLSLHGTTGEVFVGSRRIEQGGG